MFYLYIGLNPKCHHFFPFLYRFFLDPFKLFGFKRESVVFCSVEKLHGKAPTEVKKDKNRAGKGNFPASRKK